MQQDRPSTTAMAAAFLRALHPVVDDPPLVFEDPLAVDFLPDYQRRFLRRLQALPAAWIRVFRQRRSALGRMRAQILVRSRFAEDALARARTGGAGRYVILAAGLDTYAWRHAGAGAALPVLEVDHPATQGWKRRVLARRGRKEPPGVAFLPVDFEAEPLDEALDTPDRPQFVSWLGTSYYLTRPAIRGTLTALARRSPAGSRLVLDHWTEAGAADDGGTLLWSTRMATAVQLEPMRSFFDADELARLAADCGWRVVEALDAPEQNRRYLAGRRDGLLVPAFAHLALLERSDADTVTE